MYSNQILRVLGLSLLSVYATACVSTHTPKLSEPLINDKTKFSSKKYGVKGSPRVTTGKKIKKGGGRYQVGKRYKVAGKWYTPVDDPNYKKVGMASWYGPNFHGRLTANGEIYDQYALSAAHKTMPLPSYARVTNLENGSSVIVRVNDRGPFHGNREIDLSNKAAQMLGYKKKGVAKVKVEYVGKARMDGLDEKMLMASYVPPGGKAGDTPGSTLTGTMIASAESATPPGTTGLPGVKPKPTINTSEPVLMASADNMVSSRSSQGATAYSSNTGAANRGAAAALAQNSAKSGRAMSGQGGLVPADQVPQSVIASLQGQPLGNQPVIDTPTPVDAIPASVQASAGLPTPPASIPERKGSVSPVGYAADTMIRSRIANAFAAVGQPLDPQALVANDKSLNAKDAELLETTASARIDLGTYQHLSKAESLEKAVDKYSDVMIEVETNGFTVTAFADKNKIGKVVALARKYGVAAPKVTRIN